MTRLIDTQIINISPNRQRRTHDPVRHQELIESIQSPTGLLHPIIIRRENGEPFLACGERRLRAIKDIHELGGSFTFGGEDVPAGMAPYVDIGELSPLDAEVAEYDENVHRVDLPWDERAKAEAKLLELRQKVAKRDGVVTGMKEVVEELRGEATPGLIESVRKNVILAQNLHRPEVAAAKDVKSAWKMLKRSEENERNALVAEKIGGNLLVDKHQLILGNSLDWMQGYQGPKFDIICTDPPYGMGADEFGDSGGHAGGAHRYDDNEDVWRDLIREFVFLSSTITKDDAHAYVFCDFDKFHQLKRWMEDSGWKVFRTPIIWFKPSAYRAPWPEQGPQRKYECILYAVKGSLRCAHLAGDVVTCPPDENLGHQAQKPIALIRDLLARSVRPGMRVLDPFCGTGPVFPASHALSAAAVGVECDASAYGIAAQRLQRLKEGK